MEAIGWELQPKAVISEDNSCALLSILNQIYFYQILYTELCLSWIITNIELVHVSQSFHSNFLVGEIRTVVSYSSLSVIRLSPDALIVS